MSAAAIQARSDYKLSEFLPKGSEEKSGKGLEAAMKNYFVVINIALKALRSFEKRNLAKFDALVSENACQIRAVRIAIMAAKKRIDLDRLSSDIQERQRRLSQILYDRKELTKFITPPRRTKGQKKPECMKFEKLLGEERELDLNLSREQYFLIASYLLTKSKKVVGESGEKKEFSAPALLQNFGRTEPGGECISTNSSLDQIIRRAKQLLAAESVSYVQDLAQILGNMDFNEMTKDKYVYKHQGAWPCLPMFWTYKIVIGALKAKGIPIVLSCKFIDSTTDQESETKEECIVFGPKNRPRSILGGSSEIPLSDDISIQDNPDDNSTQNNPDNNAVILESKIERTAAVAALSGSTLSTSSGLDPDNPYEEFTPSNDDLTLPAVVVEGICKFAGELPDEHEWRSKVSRFEDVILAGAAHHRQYPDKSQDSLVSESPELKEFKARATREGYAEDNKSTFFIVHTFPCMLEKYPPVMKKVHSLGCKKI